MLHRTVQAAGLEMLYCSRMPPSPQDLRHMEQVLIAYKAKLHGIVSAHKKRLKQAIEEVDVHKARQIQMRVRSKKMEA